jgi:hypothetical protein
MPDQNLRTLTVPAVLRITRNSVLNVQRHVLTMHINAVLCTSSNSDNPLTVCHFQPCFTSECLLSGRVYCTASGATCVLNPVVTMECTCCASVPWYSTFQSVQIKHIFGNSCFYNMFVHNTWRLRASSAHNYPQPESCSSCLASNGKG